MARSRKIFFCTDCGNECARWVGQCAACGAWNTVVEQPEEREPRRSAGAQDPADGHIIRLGGVAEDGDTRIATGMDELDFVLGGGIVPGSLVLVGGEPGIGKSTLLLQAAARLESRAGTAMYVSGEESARQVRLRADRLEEDAGQVAFLAATGLESILDAADRATPRVVFIDSVQTVHSSAIEAGAGSVAQVRECAARLQRWAKRSGSAVFLVGHVTKDGSVAGPKTLEHIVDTVLYFEGPPGVEHRILRATKNRFGGVDEIGVFQMTARGLVPAADPSRLFLSGRRAGVSGTVVAAAVEGSRPLLVEVQALCTRASYGSPQRVANGFDRQRLALLLAVLEKRAGVAFGALDVFVNVAGGARLAEPAADLAVAVALASSALDQPAPADSVFAGEVGLGGEVRPIGRLERRLTESVRVGFRQAWVPTGSPQVDSIRLRFAHELGDTIAEVFS